MSAQSYSRDMAKLSVAKMLQTIGWNSINTTPLEILTDILVQYLMQISRTANDYANEFGCTEPNLDHVGLAFRDCHVNLAELEEYVTFVDFAQPPVAVPKYPLYKEDNLNFLKPGSKECLTRPVHIHEHLPPISITEVDNDDEATAAVTVKMEDTQQDNSAKDDSSDNTLFKRPAEVSPTETYRRNRMPSTSEPNGIGEPEQGRPTREISSVMMTTSGFISPAREGRLPDSRTPIVQGPTSEPPSPEPPAGSPPPATNNSATDGQQAQPATSEQPTDNTGEQLVVDVVKPDIPVDNVTTMDDQQLGQLASASPIIAGVLPTAGQPIVCAPTTPIMKKAKAPRKQDHQPRPRKEKLSFSGNLPGVPFPGQPEVSLIPSTKPRKPSSQANRDLARQMKKHQQQMMLLQQAQSAEMDQPMNLSTHQDVTPDVTQIHHAAKAKAKANRTLAAARRKTEKLNTTITPIPMPLALKADKLFNEPDKKKLNILKKISNYRSEGKPAALGKPPSQAEEDDRVQQMLHSDVTIELVDIRNNQAAQQQQGASGSADVQPSTNMPVKEKRKRKERVPKPRKVAKIMPMSSPTPWEDVEVVERPKTPDHVSPHGFPVLNKMPALGPNLPFPFLPQFSGPGLIPSFPNPLFPNHLLPAHLRAAALNNMLHHNPYLADAAQQLNADQSDQQEIGPFQQPRPGRQRKSPGQGASSSSGGGDGRQLLPSPVVEARTPLPPAFPGLVSSTTMSPQWHSDHNSTPHQHVASLQVSTSATAGSSSGISRDQSSAHSSPSDAVVGSTVILTPPSPAPVAIPAPAPPAVPSPPPALPSTSTSTATTAPIEQQDQQLPAPVLKLDKKNREHKKDKKDKVKKKNKKDKVKKDKLEKKKLREEMKLKLKKEKKEKRKEKDMMRGNISENVGTVPKLTLKLGSPPPKTGHQDPAGTDSAKLIVKPIILRKEDSSAADDADKKRESSPELARILPLVTGLPKPKSTQPSVSSSSKDHHIHQHHQHAPHYMDSNVRNESAAVIVKTHHAGPGRPRKQPAPTPGKQPPVQQPVQLHQEIGRVKDSHGNEVWICPHCGKQDDGSPMIGCDDCDAWYHWVCVNMQVPPEENEDWYCKNCIKKKMQSSLLPDKKKKRKKKDKEH